MKKLIALLLVAAMALSLLAACGPSTPPATTKAPEATKAPETTAPKAPETTAPKAPETTAAPELSTDWIWEDKNLSGEITFAIPFKGHQGMDAMIAEFNKSYPNIKVNLHPYSNNSDGNTATNAALTAGKIDVIASFGLAGTYKRWENGLLMDITDMIEEDEIDVKAHWGYDSYKYEDSYYSIPCGGLSYYVAINMTAWKEAGLDKKYEATGGLPTEWTWDEYIEASKLMTKKNDDGTVKVYGGSDYHSTNYFMYCYAQEVGGDLYYEADGTSSYDNPIALKALERKLKAELDDKIWFPDAVYRADGRQAQMTFCEGVTASTIICNVTRFLHDTKTYPDVNWITGFAPWPVNEKGQTNYMSGVTPFSHVGIAASIEDEDLDAAWAWLKWYATYGVKYLKAAGHEPAWRGTEEGVGVEIIYGSEEEAKKWIDIDSYNRVVGVTTNPMHAEITLTAYSDVAKALSDPIMQAINGELSAVDCLKQAAEEADAAIKDAE